MTAYALKQLVVETDERLIRKHWAGRENVLELVQDLVEKADEMVGSGLMKKVRKKLKVGKGI